MPCENYIIPLQKVYDNKPRTRRANNAITVIYDFFKKHTRKDKKDIIISSEVNEYIWKNSIQNPPRKVAVSIKIDNGKVYVFLKDSKTFKEFGKAPEKKEKISKAKTTEETKPVAEKKEEKAVTEKKESKPVVEKKETKPKVKKE
jgi:ribosomal protein L31E